jgi:mannose-6-phosphate isomerase-like protein (cupin superfamily)
MGLTAQAAESMLGRDSEPGPGGGSSMNEALVIERSAGEVVDLGVISMRILVGSERTGGSFASAEFRGGAGPWTVPHLHKTSDEAFYILEGDFVFTCGERRMAAPTGAFVWIPPGSPHMIEAGPGGGALVTTWTPGGLEEMFLELGRLPSDSITDTRVRRQIADRFDSVPV